MKLTKSLTQLTKKAENSVVAFRLADLKNRTQTGKMKIEVKNWLNGFKFLSQYQTKKGLELDNHVLFCGPPGSGKSFTIEEFCHNETSYFVKAHFESQIWVGSSIEKQQHVFNSAKELVKENAKKGETKPVAIVIEEIDSVGTKDLSGHNTSSKSEVDGLLKIFDEINEKKLNIVVVATTNNPEVLNDALVRPGRLGRRIYVNYPTGEELRKLTDYLQEVMEKNYWDNVYQSIQKNAARFQKKQMGLNFRDLQKAVTGSLESGVAENNPKIIPAASVFHEELKDVLQTRVNDRNNNLRRQSHLPPNYDDTNEEEREPKGHTLHANTQEARQFTLNILSDYQDYAENILCLGVIVGQKTVGEKFAGALETYTVECLLPDGQCLQLATSLILPFEIAPVQIAFILIGESPELINYYQEIYGLLSRHYRCQLYNKNEQVNANVLQADQEGCPFKMIIGKQELEHQEITLVRRDNVERKITIELEENEQGQRIGKIFGIINREAQELQKNLYQKSVAFRNKHIFSVANLAELEKKKKDGSKGLFLVPFCNNLDCELKIKEKVPSYSIRCIAGEERIIAPQKCLFCQSAAQNRVYLGRSY
ncbi:19227_t:CDS:2 [Racocetra fulgida]|uniref:proline--tRNA ligase n=1 Tax=Racocetra fulgida TaxID=60492 RepID=A0A9N8VFA8_9GLOM|nr:19227_t:CDS:2 [Racocetra fulgida]